MGGTIGVFLGACHILSLGQGTIDEAVFCIHDGRLSITSCFFEYAIRSPVACLQQMHIVFSSLNLSQVFSQIVTDVLIVFQQLDGKITGRIMLAYVVVGLQILLCRLRIYVISSFHYRIHLLIVLVKIYKQHLL